MIFTLDMCVFHFLNESSLEGREETGTQLAITAAMTGTASTLEEVTTSDLVVLLLCSVVVVVFGFCHMFG